MSAHDLDVLAVGISVGAMVATLMFVVIDGVRRQ